MFAAKLLSESLWRSLVATTSETLPAVIEAVFEDAQPDEEAEALQCLADALASSDDLTLWTAIFTGLGMATLERAACSFMAILERRRVPRAHWHTASAFIDPLIDINHGQEFRSNQRSISH